MRSGGRGAQNWEAPQYLFFIKFAVGGWQYLHTTDCLLITSGYPLPLERRHTGGMEWGGIGSVAMVRLEKHGDEMCIVRFCSDGAVGET